MHDLFQVQVEARSLISLIESLKRSLKESLNIDNALRCKLIAALISGDLYLAAFNDDERHGLKKFHGVIAMAVILKRSIFFIEQ